MTDETCTPTSNQRADLRWALERVKMFDPGKLMPYQEGMIAMAAEIARLRTTIKHMCDNLCSPGDCQHPDCPRATPEPRDG